MIAQKKWDLILSELDVSIQNLNSDEDAKALLDSYIIIDENYLKANAAQTFGLIWKIAFDLGKLSIASKYAQLYLDHLIEFKRIPQIKNFIKQISESGIQIKNLKYYDLYEEVLLGKRQNNDELCIEYFEIMQEHPEYWKDKPEFILQYLLVNDSWTMEHWQWCYEYILKNKNNEIILALYDKSIDLKYTVFTKKIAAYFDSHKIKYHSRKTVRIDENQSIHNKFNFDYDQMAMDHMSGKKEPSEDEQKRVINSLAQLSNDVLICEGHEMLVAFELLGMEDVVKFLCTKLINLTTDPKLRASIYYVWINSLNNNEEYFQALELIEEVMRDEPLYDNEYLALLYLKAEACLSLKKTKEAKMIYMEIKKTNPEYRLVKERLKSIETP